MVAFSPYASLLAEVPLREGEVSVLGSHTRYWDYGPVDAAVTVIAVHGFRGEHHGLDPIVAHLRGIRVLSPDLPGFGESTPMTGAEHSIAGYSSWLRGFVEALHLADQPVILGHSFGSIVTSAAVADGLQTPRLILINPIAAPALSGPKAVLTWLTVQYYRVAAALPERVGYALLSNWLIVRFTSVVMVTTKDPALRRWIHSQHQTYFSRFSDRATVLAGFDASVTSDVSMAAGRIAVPTLLIAADHDPITSVRALHRLAGLFADARLVMFEDVGHLIHYERPLEAATEIVAFLGSGQVATESARPTAGGSQRPAGSTL
ncbi:pimeloyl-ACP methyl ester carboxylesterase [Glaciihabitans tibetensis]|uniref:Pimeloyl-ACP methyl ester carboxylesterase n=1 Tax=Glaciihabitans tibetensis TaxID=1266600 RepID=A0A2T0VJQ8_9MICO|nr:alpha/beta hydrolase [Glaciihabitans tibetensis]PRY70466.1 pimeloyl-ACP methyl ester carboxylesterase [Glaciihabitans tibetensis]